MQALNLKMQQEIQFNPKNLICPRRAIQGDIGQLYADTRQLNYKIRIYKQ